LRIRIGDDARGGLEVRMPVFQHRTSQRDARIEIAGESEIADRARIAATARMLQFADNLHGADLWRTGDGTGWKCRSDHVERIAIGPRTANYVGNDVHNVAVTLDLREFGHPNGAELCDSPDIISCKIHKHDVFGAFLRVSEELSGIGFIFGGRWAACSRPGNRSDLDDVANETNVHLG